MRIKSVTVRNYRVHRDLTVPLDDRRTLIGGPNECGKSTLVEAIHRALFLKSKGVGDAHRSMGSTCFTGSPEVEVSFTAGGSDYLLAKRFSGNTGTTRLTRVGGETWHGEEAEDRLAALLKVQALGGGKGIGERLAHQWAHLWVWQGQSGENPSAQANEQRDSLLQRLQQIGGAAALQSERDAQLAARFAAAKDEIFIQAGRPKAGSEWEKAETEAAQAEANRQSAAERVERLRTAVRDFEEAAQTITHAAEDLRKLNQQKEAADTKLGRVAELRQQEAIQVPAASLAADRYQALEQTYAQISNLRSKIQTQQAALEPRNQETSNLAAAVENARQRSNQATQDYEGAVNRTRDSRLRRDLAAAWGTRFEKDARLQELVAKDDLVRGHQEQLTRLREELARLPEVTAPKLKKLQKLEAQVNQSEAALNAMAAGIEVLAAGEAVRVGDVSLGVGQSQVVTEPTEIAVGQVLRLRISPGGGTSLQEARSQARESRRELREMLDELGIAGVPDAAEAVARRRDLSVRIENADSALTGLEAASLPGILADARQAAAAAAAEVERRMTQATAVTPPATVADARQWLAAEERAVETAESAEAQAKAVRGAAIGLLATAEETISRHQQAINQQKNDLMGLRAQLNLLLENHGDDAARAAALAGALSARNSAEALLLATRQALADLQPDLLEQDRTRLERACEELRTRKRNAETTRAVAQAALRSDGTDDPEAALALATARARSAQDHFAGVRRKAEAIRLLHQLFQEEQRALAEQFTRPFAERISAYLQCLFGPGARAAVTLADNAFTGLQLARPAQGGGAVPFDSLSGGAREQVAAAVRLAMAEVLAADHDGCLPMVFDDAFAYSDPERVQILQRMLDLAVARGLQLIILTCNPSDYAALGARQVSLRLERPTPASPPIIPPASSVDSPAASLTGG